jgi:crotonobetainyl-CoA:carnitine CoA-transferase CaiB-like acyl-CoA transferase
MIAALASRGPVVPVLSVSEVFQHPQTIARGLVVRRPTPEGDVWSVFSLPFRMDQTPTDVRRVMGRLGGTDTEVRADVTRERASKVQVSSAGLRL